MNDTNGEKNIVSKFLLGDAPNIAPSQATKLKITIRMGNCKINKELKRLNSSFTKVSDSMERFSEFTIPHPNSRNDIDTIMGKIETIEWLLFHSSGYLFPARVLTKP